MKTQLHRAITGGSLLVCILFLITFQSSAQCDAITPTFNVDLSAQPHMTWISPDVNRDGYCCEADGASKCLEFVITLHPNSGAVLFNIASGAIPPGAMYYQIDCGPETAVGSPICLTGTGPFHLTFCKPGNNTNTYSIETIPNPIFGPNISLGDGCVNDLWVNFYNESSIVWNSLSPGAYGAYNGLLSCTAGCDTTTVTPNATAPTFVEYVVCGTSQNGCLTGLVCDTMSVSFTPPMTVSILAPDTVICFDELSVPATATASGGTPPYTFTWSNGTIGAAANLTPGLNTVSVNDANNCVVRTAIVNVLQVPIPILNAGSNQTLCKNLSGPVTLNGTSSNTSAVVWTGGGGGFSPNRTTQNATYTPTPAEIAAGSVSLTLSSNDISGCPAVSSTTTLQFINVASTISLASTNVSCNGLINGSVNVSVTGVSGPYTYSYDGAAYIASATRNGLTPGAHNVKVKNANGCDTLLSFVITQPLPLNASIVAPDVVLCHNETSVPATANASGGTLPYTYIWSNGTIGANADLTPGANTVTVRDLNNCAVVSDEVNVTQLPIPTLLTDVNQTLCKNLSGPVSLNGTSSNTSAVVWSGGNGNYAPNNTSANTSYAPTPGEIASGSLTLTLNSNDISGCPVMSSTTTIQFIDVASSISLTPTNVSCTGLNNGSVDVIVAGTSGPYTYSYDGAAYIASSTMTGLAPGIHNVEVKNGIGCDTVLSFQITEPTPLVVTEKSHTDVLCFNGTDGKAEVAAIGGTSPYSYSWDCLPIQNAPLMTGVQAGTYTATVQDANNCIEVLQVTINQPTQLNLVLNIVPPTCFGQTNGAINAVVSGGTSPYVFDWSTGSTAVSIFNMGAGLVSLTVTDLNGCTVSVNEMVSEPAALNLSINNDTVVCPGLPVNIVANASGGTGNYTYKWNTPDANVSMISVTPISNQIVQCLVQDNNGCFANDLVNVTVYQLNQSDLNATISDDTICVNSEIDLSGNYVGNNPTVDLEWTFCSTCSNNTSLIPTTSQTYTIVATDQCGQQIIANVSIVVILPPLLKLNPLITSVCPEEYFSVSNNSLNNSSWDYFWDFGDGSRSNDMTAIHAYKEPGTYTISLFVINEFGCPAQDTVSGQVVVNPSAVAEFSSSSYEETTINPKFTFTNSSINANTFQWHFGDGESSSDINPVHIYAEYGSFTITLNANNEFNCPSQSQRTVEVKPEYTIYVPNAFTPDNDGHNENFLVQGTNISDKNFEFEIYNRWGEMVFKSNDLAEGWDGKYKGLEHVQDGVFTWVVRFRDLMDDRHEVTGHVSILK